MRNHTFIKAAMLIVAVAIVSSCHKKIDFTYTEVEAAVQDVITSVENSCITYHYCIGLLGPP